MLLHNLNHSLFQSSIYFWERRFVFEWGEKIDNSVVKIPEGVEAEEQNTSKQEEVNADSAINNADKWVEDSKQILTGAAKENPNAAKVDVISETVWKNYTEITHKIWNQEVVIKFTEALKIQPEQPEATQESVNTEGQEAVSQTLNAIVDMEGFGNVSLWSDVGTKLAKSLQGKENMGEFLAKQLKNPESEQSKIVLKGVAEIANRLEVKEDQRENAQKLIKGIEAYKEQNSAELQNIVMRKFSITEKDDKIIVVDKLNSDQEIDNPNTIIKNYLDTEIKNQKWEKLEDKIEGLDKLQWDALKEVQKQIQQAKEAGEDDEMSFGDLIKAIIEWISTITSWNYEKLSSLVMWMELEQSSSKTDKLKITYKEGENPDKSDIFALLKDKIVTINKGKNEEQKIKITKESDITSIKVLEDGEMEVTINPKKEAEKENSQLQDGNQEINIKGEEAKKMLKSLNANNKATLATLGGKDLKFAKPVWIGIENLTVTNGKVYLEMQDGNMSFDIQSKSNQLFIVPAEDNPDGFKLSFNKETGVINLEEKENKI